MKSLNKKYSKKMMSYGIGIGVTSILLVSYLSMGRGVESEEPLVDSTAVSTETVLTKAIPIDEPIASVDTIEDTSLEPMLEPVEELAVVKGPEHETIIDAVLPTDEQAALLYDVEEVAVRDCMNERGFEYIPNTFNEDTASLERKAAVTLGDVEEASVRGYGIVEMLTEQTHAVGADNVGSDTGLGSPSAEMLSANTEYVAGLTPEQQSAWTAALQGEPFQTGSTVTVERSAHDSASQDSVSWDSSSCLSAARRAIYGSDIAQMEEIIAVESLRKGLWENIENDATYIYTLGEWQTCMVQNDAPYQHPGEARGKLTNEYARGELSLDELAAKEIKVAAADATCYRQFKLGEMLVDAKERAGNTLLNDNHALFSQLNNSMRSAVKVAQQYQR